MPDFPRLALAIQARATALGWLQRDLLSHTSLSRETIQSLWRGDRAYAPSTATRVELERVLRWAPGSVEAILNGGDPTELPEAGASRESPRTDGRSPLPLKVQLALESGQPLDYDVLEFEVGGRQLSIIAIAQTGVYDTDEERAALLEQIQTFRRMMDGVRREGEGAVPDGETDDQ